MICDYIMDIEKEKELIGLQAQVSILYELIQSDYFNSLSDMIFLTNKIKEIESSISQIEATC